MNWRTRVFVCVVAVLAAASATTVRAEDASALGAWNVSVLTDDGQELTAKLDIAKDGDGLGGKYTFMDGQNAKLEDLKVEGNDLSFKIKLDFQGANLAASFKTKVDGDKLDGTVDYDLEGQTGTLNVKGERAKSGGVAGNWDLQVVTDDGQTLDSKLAVSEKDGKLEGVYTGMDGSEVPAQNLKFENDELSFKIEADFQGAKLIANFKGAVKGEELDGKVDFDLEGQTGTLNVKGKKAGAAGASDVAGKWEIEVVTDDGQTLPSTVNLSKDGDKVAGKFAGADGKEVDLEEIKVDGKKLGFKVTLDFEGTQLVAIFAGEVEGDKYKGKVDYDLGGQTGSLGFDAKRGGKSDDAAKADESKDDEKKDEEKKDDAK